MQLNLKEALPQKIYNAGMEVSKTLTKAGYQIYLVGGSVRDLLLQRKVSDLDFTTNAHPKVVKSLFKKTIPVGERFGTILVIQNKVPFEITTFRLETGYTDARRPDFIVFGESLVEDVKRRDFTINGLAVIFETGEVIDFVNGLDDIENGIVRCIGDAFERFSEDGLRPIRACRFAATLDFALDKEIPEAIKNTRDKIYKVAPERFYDEWRKTLKIENKTHFFELMFATQIFSIFFQSFHALHKEKAKKKLANLLAGAHIESMGEYASIVFTAELAARGIALPCESLPNDLNNFFREIRFAKKEERLCRALLKSPFIEIVEQEKSSWALIKQAMSKIESEQLPSHARIVPVLVGKKAFASLLKKTIQNLHTSGQPYRLAHLAVSGNDLINWGIQGPDVGKKLSALLSLVITNPEKNQLEILKKELQELEEL